MELVCPLSLTDENLKIHCLLIFDTIPVRLDYIEIQIREFRQIKLYV